MARYFIDIAYDGTNYHGWQVQPNGSSVQETLSKALSVILRSPVLLTGAGRTDAGVHARLMVAHFDFECLLDCAAVTVKLNRLLPPDIVVYRIRQVTDNAHARFDAVYRTYNYHISTRKSPFDRQYTWLVNFPLDFHRMNEAASVLFDYIDFTSFSKLHTDVKTNNCQIMQARWMQAHEFEWFFTIQADRFLRNMVRAIVGTLVEVGRGKLTVDGFRDIIEAKNRCCAGTSAPGNALFLVDIGYPDMLFVD
jgi:tRNA pseudouridine38-40 synthase